MNGLHETLKVPMTQCRECREYTLRGETCPCVQTTPCETPAHNGIYRGTLPVRLIPPGICGGEQPNHGMTSATAIERQRVLHAERAATSIQRDRRKGQGRSSDKQVRRARSRPASNMGTENAKQASRLSHGLKGNQHSGRKSLPINAPSRNQPDAD
jgi:hypothetical protein